MKNRDEIKRFVRIGVAMVFFVAACGSSDGGSTGSGGGGGTTPTGGGGGGGGTPPTGGGGGGGGGGNASGCFGDFTLGKSLYATRDTRSMGAACDPESAPRNCLDGYYIKMNNAEGCRCIAACSSFQNVSVGGSCGTGWPCQAIQATNASANRMTACVKATWNLCQSSGGGSGGSGGGSGGGGTTTPPSTCKPLGRACSDDNECCSSSCMASKCWSAD